MSKKFLLSAIFAAGAVGAPAVAGDMQVLNEEELEEVSAQGFQDVVNNTRNWGGSRNQNNNLDSVQMNGSAQIDARAADLVAAATSSVNIAINILWNDADPPDPETVEPVTTTDELVFPVRLPGPGSPQPYGYSYDQDNTQKARNHMNTATGSERAEAFNSDKETQNITNNVYEAVLTDADGNPITDNNGGPVYSSGTVEGQDNNNNSVQLNDGAQQNARGIFVENSAQSASNSGLNVFAGSVEYISGTQDNNQEASNMVNSAKAVDGDGVPTGEAYAYNGEGASATQTVSNNSDSNNPTETEINVSDQDNNNNSVQLNDTAQQNATGITVNNNANSAKNFGLNLHASFGPLGTDDNGTISSDLSQKNKQRAYNHNNDAEGTIASAKNYNKEMQTVVNGLDQPSNMVNIQAQDNNNNSVQLNNAAQQSAAGLEIRNSAISAYNTGINVMYFESADGASLTQENDQRAKNMSNEASGVSKADALNGEWDEEANVPTQSVTTNSNVSGQNNNNNSVQLNDSAQQSAAALAMVNNANSSQNSGLNILVDYIVGDQSSNGDTTTPLKGINSTTVTQTNKQHAYNHYNYAKATEEDAYAGNINKQSQEVINSDKVGEREVQVYIVDNSNNNNSVQLNDEAQQNARALEITNMAVSSANTGFNIAIFYSVTDSTITQTNKQTASNFENKAYGTANAEAVNGEFSEKPGQHIRNVHAQIGGEDDDGNIIDGQDNNNNSVQLNDNAQENAQGLSIANIAKVALNSAFNVIWVKNDTSNATITQTNTQTAGNHNNLAEGGVALAMNDTKQNQLIENCYCANIFDQNNNQNSVQVNDNAQANLKGWHVLNGATSAVNMATNLMATEGTVSGTVLIQTNTQTATNFSNTAMGTNATAGNFK